MGLRALGEHEKLLGDEYPYMISCAWILSHILQAQERYHEASILYRRALAGYEKTYGLDHPMTQRCSQYYASLVREMRDQDKTVDTSGQTQRISEESLHV